MFSPNIDLGQIIIATLIATIGYFVKRAIDSIYDRLGEHEDRLYELSGSLQRLVGIIYTIRPDIDTRRIPRE